MGSKDLGFRVVGAMKPVLGTKNEISMSQCRKRTEWQRKCIGQRKQVRGRKHHGWTMGGW